MVLALMFSRAVKTTWRTLADFRKDFYTELSLIKTATPSDIKAAYHKLAKQWHPDSPTGNPDKFKDVAEAYEVLSDPVQRSSYDAARSGEFHTGSQRQNLYYADFFKWNPYGRQNEYAYKRREAYQESKSQQNPQGRRYTFERVDPFTGKKTIYTYFEDNSWEEIRSQQKQAEQFFRESMAQHPFERDNKSNTWRSARRTRLKEEDQRSIRYMRNVIGVTLAIIGALTCLNAFSNRLRWRDDGTFRPPRQFD